ncbi:hypothetical protein QUB56_35215, partial [Microcoleus sp. AR_TQ3_B6]|uniref:hypothetical protein n=1 Tax=Microcoleus sp. AR_TQ3_B6 TaxID=3055284 RepID=UPI002FD691D8
TSLLSTWNAGCNPYEVYFLDLFVTPPGSTTSKQGVRHTEKTRKAPGNKFIKIQKVTLKESRV